MIKLFEQIGFSGYERLRRGVGHDWDEIIYQNPDLEEYFFGEGEMRFMITK